MQEIQVDQPAITRLENVSLLYPFAIETAVGETDQAVGSFITTKDVSELNLELFIPSTHRFLGVTDNYSGYAASPFGSNSWQACRPSSIITRYDRLHVIYSEIEAGTRCDLAMPVIQQFEGESTPSPMRVWDEVFGRVRGTTVVDSSK